MNLSRNILGKLRHLRIFPGCQKEYCLITKSIISALSDVTERKKFIRIRPAKTVFEGKVASNKFSINIIKIYPEVPYVKIVGEVIKDRLIIRVIVRRFFMFYFWLVNLIIIFMLIMVTSLIIGSSAIFLLIGLLFYGILIGLLWNNFRETRKKMSMEIETSIAALEKIIVPNTTSKMIKDNHGKPLTGGYTPK